MNDLATAGEVATGVPDFFKPSALMDPVRFQHLSTVARVMADSSLLPDTLKGGTAQQTYANAFMVVNISERWGTDPFLTAQCVSVVYGKLMVEGKLVAAVLEKTYGIVLDYEHIRDEKGVVTGIKVSGPRRKDGKIVAIEGTIDGWKTKAKDGTVLKQWQLPQAETQLIYRGSREWVRVYEPGVLLGIITDDEYDPAYNARDITPTRTEGAGQSVIDQIRAGKTKTSGTAGFDADRVSDITESAEQHSAGKEGAAVSNDASSAEEGDVTATKASPSSDGNKEEQDAASATSPDEGSATASQAEPSPDQIAWRDNVVKMLWGATAPKSGEEGARVFRNQNKAAAESFPTPGNLHPRIKANIDRIRDICFDVIEGKMPAAGKQSAVHFISNITGMTVAEIGGEKK